MKQISLSLNENEFDKFMSLLKSFKSVKNIQTSETEIDNYVLSEEHKAIIENRLDNYSKDESKSQSWDEIKSKLKKLK